MFKRVFAQVMMGGASMFLEMILSIGESEAFIDAPPGVTWLLWWILLNLMVYLPREEKKRGKSES